MYVPTDDYIQKCIKEGIKKLQEAYDESTDKMQTCKDICEKIEKEFPIEAGLRY